MGRYHILLVDDDPFILQGVAKELKNEGYQVTAAENGEKAFVLLEQTCFDLVITDLVMEQVDGIQVLKKAKQLYPETMVIILTGFGDMTTAIEALRLEADDYVLKPCHPEELNMRVARCFQKYELAKKVKLYEKILPVCCLCKKIRDDTGRAPGKGHWMQMENYMYTKAKVAVTSTYCPECAQRIKSEIEQ